MFKVCWAGFAPSFSIKKEALMRTIDAIIAPPPLSTRFAKIILREFIGASNVSMYAINAPPKFAPKIMIDAARTGSIDWAVNVTNNNTAATLE